MISGRNRFCLFAMICIWFHKATQTDWSRATKLFRESNSRIKMIYVDLIREGRWPAWKKPMTSLAVRGQTTLHPKKSEKKIPAKPSSAGVFKAPNWNTSCFTSSSVTSSVSAWFLSSVITLLKLDPIKLKNYKHRSGARTLNPCVPRNLVGSTRNIGQYS